jgi:protein-L-isoaspartate(D-aspartate) O-methyltransferase
MAMLSLDRERERMVDVQIARRGIRDRNVLDAMRTVPREAFVPAGMEEFAYEDSPLPIEAGQTISQPFIVAMMIEAAGIKPGDTVLEIGAGSGYAAAVISRIAAKVHAIERHEQLTERAAARLKKLGYGNIELRTGDGTLGWPEAAPFDAILAAAGGPRIPEALKQQLAPRGRLVMPVGDDPRQQSLIKLTRIGENEFEEEDLGAVMFVPLIGAQGWSEEDRGEARLRRGGLKAPSLRQLIREAAEPLPSLESAGFGAIVDRFAAAKVVLMGEASHGTSEFYRARAAMTQRLIEKHGFTIVAVEADWPDAAAIDRYVRHRLPRADAEKAFTRFPTWMWRNAEVVEFIEWLRHRNRPLFNDERAAFYGLDIYSLSASMRAVIDFLDRVDPEAAAVARQRYGCLMPWSNEPQSYGRMAVTSGFARCEQPVTQMLRDLLDKRLDYVGKDGESFLDAAQNARLVRSAEAYYRSIYFGSTESWNLRDRHMFETLEAVLGARRKDARAVVWAHNSHIGNAAFTEMGLARAQINIGQLCRERYGNDAVLIGFGTHAGTVACASDWDEPMQVKRVNPSLPDSYERMVHDADVTRCLLDLREGNHEQLRHRLLEPRLERFIGVIYRPETERWSHYSECSLPRQFDAYVWFDETTAVTPLPTPPREGADETWPFGL